MPRYVIYDVKYSTYYSRGQQYNRNGTVGPRWSRDLSDAIVFNSAKEARIVLSRLKSLRSQNNSSCIYVNLDNMNIY